MDDVREGNHVRANTYLPGRRGRVAIGFALLLSALTGSACSGDAGDDTGSLPPPAEMSLAESTEVRTSSSSPARTDSVPVALFAGTSLTAGLGLDPSDAYPAVLQRMADSAGLSVRVVNGGLSGETSAGLVRRLPWMLQQPVDLVVIETGANDGLRGLDVDSTRANLTRAVAAVRETRPDARVLLVQMEAPPNLGPEYTSRFRDMYPAVASETGAGLVPFLLDGVAGDRSLNQADGIHPNEAGARIAARTVWPAFSDAIESVSGSVAGASKNR